MSSPLPLLGEARAQDHAPALEVRGLSVEFQTPGGPLRAVNEVSFTLGSGRILAILGESGSGKSMLLRTIVGVQPTSARVSGALLMGGTELLALPPGERARLRGGRLSMVFQNPMTALDPVFTVEQQIVETVRRHTSLSAGQARARALELLHGLQRRLGMSMIVVTHDVAVAAEIADDVLVMYAGRVLESGPVRTVLDGPAHPYTQGLLRANVRPGQRERPVAISGSPPSLAGLPECCAFAPRCPQVMERCWRAVPELYGASGGHAARCVLVEGKVG